MKVIKWVDKRQVLMISTHAEDTNVLVLSDKNINREGESLLKPMCGCIQFCKEGS